MFTAHGVSHPGHVRKINEDAWRIEAELGLSLVADGMGGHNAGEIASGLAIEAISGFMRRTQDDNDVTWPFGVDPRLSYDANRLMTAVKLANRRVFKSGESRDEYTGMGTTVVATLITGGQLAYAAVGDSRIYSHREGRLEQITTDDSWVAAMAAEGLVEPVPANHPMRHVLTSVIGAREQVEVHLAERPLVDGETLLLCSDGLHGELSEDTIGELLGSGADIEAIATGLVQRVLEGKAGDNLTAVVVRYRA